jgi:hypothetical protein
MKIKDDSHFNFIINSAAGVAINPTLHYPLRAVGSGNRVKVSIVN